MPNAIAKDISLKLRDIKNCSNEMSQITGDLWGRWFENLSIRLGVSPQQLYESISVDISHVQDVVSLVGKDIDLPDQLKDNPDLLSVLSNSEVMAYLENTIDLSPNRKKSDSDALLEWQGDNKLIDSDGKPQVFYHGSFADFSSFSEKEQRKFSRLGTGYYFTTNPQDASDNYATPDSPEVRAQAQAIQMELMKGGTPIKQINYQKIKEDLVKDGGVVYPVYLKMERPFIISENEPYHLGEHDKAITFGAFTTNIVLEHNGSMSDVELLQKRLNGAVSTLDAVNVIQEFARYNGFNGLTNQIIQSSNYDGIIDESAGKLWHTPDDAHHVIVFNPNQIKSAIGNNGSYSQTTDNILFQSAPEYDSVLFQFGGINALRSNKTMLQAAKRLSEKGEDMERIRKLTGWFKWVDDKWRFEFDDSQAMLNRHVLTETSDHFDRVAARHINPKAKFDNLAPKEQDYIVNNFTPSLRFNGDLGSALSHNHLFLYYPQLKNINLSLEIHPDLAQTTGSLTNGMPPHNQLRIRAKNGNEAFSAILHEIQHAIQTIEGFAEGGSVANYNNVPSETKTFYNRQLSDLQFVFDLADTRNLSLPEAAELAGSNIASTSARLAVTNSEQQLKDYIKKLECEQRSPRTRYLYLAGEYEARQTTNRQNLSSTQRTKTPVDFYEQIDTSKLEVVINDKPKSIRRFDFGESEALGSILRNPSQSKFHLLLSNSFNQSTLVHESSHLFLDLFINQALKESAPDCIKEDYQKICDFVGAKAGEPLTKHQNELWAEACESYFLSQDKRVEKQPPAFQRIQDLMKDVYAESDPLGIELSEEITGVLNRMFSSGTTHKEIDFGQLSQLLNDQEPLQSTIQPR